MSKSRRSDGQKSGLAGEFFVAAELLKRGHQVSLTFGNAKAIDLFVHNEVLGHTFNVQVKTLRRPNCFPLDISRVDPAHVFVFVLLNEVGKQVAYFPISGREIIAREGELFGGGKGTGKMPAILLSRLRPRRDRWDVFDATGTSGG